MTVQSVALPVSRAEFIRDPYPLLAGCRRQSPILWADFFGDEAWLVTGYPEAESMMRDDDRFLRDGRSLAADSPGHSSASLAAALNVKHRMILVRDAPFHTRVRGLVNRAFTPRLVKGLTPMIEELALELLRRRQGYTSHELVTQFAHPLPMHVIARILGLPDDDRPLFAGWSGACLKFIDFRHGTGELETASAAMLEAELYFKDTLRAKRRSPRDDLISHLLEMQAAGAEITDDELVSTALIILCAGEETTVNFIGTGYYQLLKHADQYAMLRQDRSLIPNAVEELLRYEAPAFTTSRWVARDMEYAGGRMRRGQFVVIAVGGANRDPRVTPDPDRLDVTRKPVKHISFAAGPHYCLGAPLARLEGRIALEMLLQHVLHPVVSAEPEWRETLAVRGLRTLPLEAEVRIAA